MGNPSAYVTNRNLEGEVGILTLFKDYQNLISHSILRGNIIPDWMNIEVNTSSKQQSKLGAVIYIQNLPVLKKDGTM